MLDGKKSDVMDKHVQLKTLIVDALSPIVGSGQRPKALARTTKTRTHSEECFRLRQPFQSST